MTTAPGDMVIQDNPEARQYELRVGEETAVITYHLRRGKITFIHTDVPPALQGQGVASRMALYALDDARRRGLDVIPVCTYLASFIRRHRDYRDLVPSWAEERYLGEETRAQD